MRVRKRTRGNRKKVTTENGHVAKEKVVGEMSFEDELRIHSPGIEAPPQDRKNKETYFLETPEGIQLCCPLILTL